MEYKRSEAVSRLCSQLAPLRGLWNGFESDLVEMGVTSLDDLRGRSADELLQDYCRRNQRPVDALLRPYFSAVVRFSETRQDYPWWRIMREEVLRERDQIIAAGPG